MLLSVLVVSKSHDSWWLGIFSGMSGRQTVPLFPMITLSFDFPPALSFCTSAEMWLAYSVDRYSTHSSFCCRRQTKRRHCAFLLLSSHECLAPVLPGKLCDLYFSIHSLSGSGQTGLHWFTCAGFEYSLLNA